MGDCNFNNISKEELQKIQVDLLTTQIEDNPDMPYFDDNLANLGLNPLYFSGPNTTIVNAINSTYAQTIIAKKMITNFTQSTNNILLDTNQLYGNKIWLLLVDEMKKLTEKYPSVISGNTVIEMLYILLADVIPNFVTKENDNDIASPDELINLYKNVTNEGVVKNE